MTSFMLNLKVPFFTAHKSFCQLHSHSRYYTNSCFDFYDFLLKNAIFVNNIPYTNDNFLRMSLHQELSRPYGDVSRWEKIYKRMNILNKYYKLNFIPVKNNPVVSSYKPSKGHEQIKRNVVDFFIQKINVCFVIQTWSTVFIRSL